MERVADPGPKRQLVPADRRIFLSYAWLDDEVPAVGAAKAPGWVLHLYEHLRLALRHQLGGEVDFWRDLKDIGPNDVFAQLIEEALQGSLLLLAVVSPSYLNSQWCHWERERFLAEHGGDSREAIERVVKVLKHQIEESKLPAELQGRKGYRFFMVDPIKKKGEISFYFNGHLRYPVEYLETVERLAEYLVDRLGTLKRRRVGPGSPLAPSPEVFVALSQGSDASEPTLRVRVELQSAGLQVGDAPAQPTSEEEARAALSELMARAAAAVHVVGRCAGAKLRCDGVPAVHLQLDESGRRADRDPRFRRYIFIMATHVQGSDEHREFVSRLQDDITDGGLMRPNDTLMVEQPGRVTVQEFIQVLREGLVA
jgi:hypothetical protein